ncbi:MAG: type II toxin-antitoxin system VapC family toxin [Armatimonadetes bacterium]|nr:type II toxin-antitoxin system VapC family toxin [Armatimonadota bacterium]
MNQDKMLVDTVFIQAILNRRDQYHRQAIRYLPRVQAAAEVWITEAIMLEVGAALKAYNRSGAAMFLRKCYTTPNMRMRSIDTPLMLRALDLYEARPDKSWSLTDCISFIVMAEHDIREAITADVHIALIHLLGLSGDTDRATRIRAASLISPIRLSVVGALG